MLLVNMYNLFKKNHIISYFIVLIWLEIQYFKINVSHSYTKNVQILDQFN